jgi:hypothetical protein
MIRINNKKGEAMLSCHDDACLFILEEGRGRLVIPDEIDTDNPPDHAVLAAAMAGFSASPEGVRVLLEWYQEKMGVQEAAAAEDK